MAAKPAQAQRVMRNAAALDAVEAFLAARAHPHKPAILALRQLILAADPRIAEGVKWNSLSFRTTEYFATFHLRAKQGIQLILHRGAKPREPGADMLLDDPEGLLTWLAQDRASVSFRDLAEIEARSRTFTQIIRQWISYV